MARFTRTPGSGALTHQPTRHPIDLRGGSPGPPGSGDVTDGANVNARGIGVFHAKSGTILQFRGIASLSALITVTLDAGDATIDLDVDTGALLGLLPDFARRDLPNTFLDTQTFEDYLDLVALGSDPGNPAIGSMRLFVRETGGNIELVSRAPTGAECVLCSKTATAGGGTLLFNGIEP